MKKVLYLVVIFLMMSFASNSLFAQNEEGAVYSSQDQDTVSVVSESQVATVESEGQSGEGTTASTPLTMNDLQSLVALLNNTTNGKKQNILNGDGKVFVPLTKKEKFSGHHICQRLELSISGGKDKVSGDDPELDGLIAAKRQGKQNSSEDEKDFSDDLSDKGLGLNAGANFGYSAVFVPGYQKGDSLLLNNFGFAYSVGAIFQFDHEKKAGVTCDFLGKIGVETGFNKAIGVGADFLFGGGKTAQTVIDIGDLDFENPDVDDLIITQENNWCAKVGTQLWLRLNFLTKSLNNFDTALFTRFVYSFQPYSSEDRLHRMEMYDEITFWQAEAWTFGFTATYFF